MTAMGDAYDERLARLERAVSDLATIGIRSAATIDRLALTVDRLALTIDQVARGLDLTGATVDRLAGHVDRLTIIITDHIENHRPDQ